MSADNRVIAVVPSPQEFQRICGILAQDRISVEQASSVLEAVLLHAYARLGDSGARRAPVVLFDIDGASSPWRDALEQFRMVHPASRFIFLSRLADENLWLEVLKAGEHDLLSCPVVESELRHAVLRALDRAARSLAAAA